MIPCVPDPLVKCNLPYQTPRYVAIKLSTKHKVQCLGTRTNAWLQDIAGIGSINSNEKIWKHVCRMIFEILMETSLVREKNFMSWYSSSGMFVYLRDVTFPIVAFFIRKDSKIPLSRNLYIKLANPGWRHYGPSLHLQWKCIQGA